MREGLRMLGFAVLLGGGLSLLALSLTESFDSSSPALADWAQSADVRRYLWIAAGALYVAGGIFLSFLRRWSSVLFIIGAVVAAASMAYDMAAFSGDVAQDLAASGSRIGADVVSLVCALALTALTVPLAQRRILK
jgi:hypothetical protein